MAGLCLEHEACVEGKNMHNALTVLCDKADVASNHARRRVAQGLSG